MGIEAGLTAIAFASAFAWPRIASTWFSRIERIFAGVAQKHHLAVVAIGLSAILLRLAILPLHPIPSPFVVDDFSNLLAADTFSHGRLTNPTPDMWVHFESIHIDMKPTYMSMYFPAEGLMLAAGKVFFGRPWFGILIAGAMMCASLCWMLQAWLPPSWALLGGFIAVLRLALFSYWTNTYHTGGSIAALGGALVLGSLPRFMKAANARNGLLLATGILIVGLTRPFEGLLLFLPVVAALGCWIVTTKNRPGAAGLFRCTAPALILLFAGSAWMAYYNYRVFGSPTTLPYTVNRAAYATAPYFVWQKPRPEPAYRHAEIRRFYKVNELDDYYRVVSRPGLPTMTLVKAARGVFFFSGVAFIPSLFMLPWAFRDRRIRFLVLCLVTLAAGMTLEIFLFPHYLAPFTAAFYGVGLQAMRHLWHWRPGDQEVGKAICRLTVTICVLMGALRLFDRQLHCAVPGMPVSTWICNWFGPDHFEPERANIERGLEQIPGGQLAIVRYSSSHDPIDEWVYNAADIDQSKIIWARDMDGTSNRELIQYYYNRRVWLVQPDLPSARIVPYPVSELVTGASQ